MYPKTLSEPQKATTHHNCLVGHQMYDTCSLQYAPGFFEEDGQPKLTEPSLLATGVPERRLLHIGNVFSSIPEEFSVHGGWLGGKGGKGRREGREGRKSTPVP